MRDILSDLDRWQARNEPVALATVVQTWGSAPRAVGAKMAMTAGGEIAGSVSGGCVEGAVFETGVETLNTARPQLLHFGVADDTAWDVGLACGGIIEVFVERLDPLWYVALRAAIIEEGRAALLTVLRGADELLGRKLLAGDDGKTFGALGGAQSVEGAAMAAARAALDGGGSRRVMLDGQTEAFVEVLTPAPTLVIIGGVHIAIALASIAKTLGYRTIVVDPRKAFGSEARFPHIDRLIQAWPDQALKEIGLTRSTAVVMLTHDPKLDDPALKIALPSSAFYVGALGSRTTQEQRRKRLEAEGLAEADLARLYGPIGLTIGAQTPEEIALAVMAEIVAARNSA